jgi:hypothetical protein
MGNGWQMRGGGEDTKHLASHLYVGGGKKKLIAKMGVKI